MPNSPQFPLFAHNSTVKAWCWTGTSTTKSLNPSQNLFDETNFIDGYNLRLDAVSQVGIAATTTDVYYGALRFVFIEPMEHTKYKVFLQYSIQGGGNSVGYCHVLNSSLYPKTTTGFWVRCGCPIVQGVHANQIVANTFGPDVWVTNLRVVVL